jgi:hypothetical protein
MREPVGDVLARVQVEICGPICPAARAHSMTHSFTLSSRALESRHT